MLLVEVGHEQKNLSHPGDRTLVHLYHGGGSYRSPRGRTDIALRRDLAAALSASAASAAASASASAAAAAAARAIS